MRLKEAKEQKPGFLDWLCSGARATVDPLVGPLALPPPAEKPPSENGVQRMIKRSACGAQQGLVDATRLLGRTATGLVQHASSAATLLVDDLDRHTLHRPKGPSRYSFDGPLVRQRAPRVFARLQPTHESSVSSQESRLSHSDRVVKVAAEYAHMAPLSFVLDGVLGPTSDQAAAYASLCAEATEGLLRGESATLIAFGAPGTGKTHTLFGPTSHLSNAANTSAWQEWGLLPRASHHLFTRASAVGGVEGLFGHGATVTCTFLEVTDDAIYDLLGKNGRPLRLRESAKLGVHVPEATQRLVEWEEDVMRALLIGLQNRADAGHRTPSSRSGAGGGAHAIFTLTVSVRVGASGEMQHSSLQLVDLGAAETHRPGSGNGTGSGGTGGTVGKPPANMSLSALNTCINALAESTAFSSTLPSTTNPNPQGIPYRDSKLTWLLRDALGGDAIGAARPMQTVFIACCGAEPGKLPHSINSLRFAQRCRQARVWVADASPAPPSTPPLALQQRSPAADVVSPGASSVATSPPGSAANGLATPPRSVAKRMRDAEIGGGGISHFLRSSPPSRGADSREMMASSLGVNLSGPVNVSPSDEDVSSDEEGESPPTPHPKPMHLRSAERKTRGDADPDDNLPSSHAAEAAILLEKLAAVQAQQTASERSTVRSMIEATLAAEMAESATPLGGEGFLALQSAHAHMVLLEARLAELATAPPAVPLSKGDLG